MSPIFGRFAFRDGDSVTVETITAKLHRNIDPATDREGFKFWITPNRERDEFMSLNFSEGSKFKVINTGQVVKGRSAKIILPEKSGEKSEVAIISVEKNTISTQGVGMLVLEVKVIKEIGDISSTCPVIWRSPTSRSILPICELIRIE